MKSRVVLHHLMNKVTGLTDKWKEEKKALDHIKELKDQKVRLRSFER